MRCVLCSFSPSMSHIEEIYRHNYTTVFTSSLVELSNLFATQHQYISVQLWSRHVKISLLLPVFLKSIKLYYHAFISQFHSHDLCLCSNHCIVFAHNEFSHLLKLYLRWLFSMFYSFFKFISRDRVGILVLIEYLV